MDQSRPPRGGGGRGDGKCPGARQFFGACQGFKTVIFAFPLPNGHNKGPVAAVPRGLKFLSAGLGSVSINQIQTNCSYFMSKNLI